MSHITRRKSALKDAAIIKKTCDRFGIKYLGHTTRARGAAQGGHQFKLKGWTNPVTVDATGECIFDNYSGRWGDEAELDKFKQGYAVEAAKAQAKVEGHEFEEQNLANGSIKCTISLGGGYDTEESGGGDGYDV